MTITTTSETFSTQENHLQIQSHYDVVMSSPNSQSNSTMVMTPYESNQSAMNTTRVHHQLGSGLEMRMPAPKYQHIIRYLPYSNNAWYYPRLDNMQLQKFPEKGERLFYTGKYQRPIESKVRKLDISDSIQNTPALSLFLLRIMQVSQSQCNI